jgi:Icc-related predicted phosphoesterase
MLHTPEEVQQKFVDIVKGQKADAMVMAGICQRIQIEISRQHHLQVQEAEEKEE